MIGGEASAWQLKLAGYRFPGAYCPRLLNFGSCWRDSLPARTALKYWALLSQSGLTATRSSITLRALTQLGETKGESTSKQTSEYHRSAGNDCLLRTSMPIFLKQ